MPVACHIVCFGMINIFRIYKHRPQRKASSCLVGKNKYNSLCADVKLQFSGCSLTMTKHLSGVRRAAAPISEPCLQWWASATATCLCTPSSGLLAKIMFLLVIKNDKKCHKAPCIMSINVIYDHIRAQGPSFLVGLLPRLERRHRHRRTAPQAAWPHRRPPPAGNPAPPAPAAEPPGPARDKAFRW